MRAISGVRMPLEGQRMEDSRLEANVLEDINRKTDGLSPKEQVEDLTRGRWPTDIDEQCCPVTSKFVLYYTLVGTV